MKLSLRKIHIADIIEHAKSEFPNEACGFLAGEGRRVGKVYRMANAEKATIRYSMDLAEQFNAVRDMRAHGLGIVGIYHSHPDSRPCPSLMDIKLALYSECSYVIVSLINGIPEIRSFKIKNGITEEEEIDVV